LSIKTQRWAGVETSEPILEVPYRFRYGDKSEDGLLVGLPAGHSLYNLYSSEGQPVMVESDQLVLTKLLEKQLAVETGDMVQLQPIFGVVGEAEVRVGNFIDLAHGGAMGFLPLKQLQQMLEAPGSANGLLLDLEDESTPGLGRKLDNLPGIDAIAFKAADKEICLGDHMAFLYAFIYVMLLFGTILGGTIVFSSVTVSIQERVRELSTLRTIGMSFWRLASLITIENLILGGIGIALGLLAGKWLSPVLVNIAQTEEFFMLPVFSAQSYLVTVVAMLLVLLVSQIPSLRYVGHLNLASATKDWTA
jgi:putative ABC transport system permease protein